MMSRVHNTMGSAMSVVTTRGSVSKSPSRVGLPMPMQYHWGSSPTAEKATASRAADRRSSGTDSRAVSTPASGSTITDSSSRVWMLSR